MLVMLVDADVCDYGGVTVVMVVAVRPVPESWLLQDRLPFLAFLLFQVHPQLL